MHLAAQVELGREAGIPSALVAPNGSIARLAPDPMVRHNAIPVGRLYRDGSVLGTKDEIGVQDRRRLALSGHVVVTVLLDHRGEPDGDPQITLVGLPVRDPGGRPFVTLVAKAVRGAIASIPRPRRTDEDTVADAVRRSVRAAVEEAWGKKPVCTVHVAVIE